MNLFAITENNNEEVICRIPLSQGVQTEINNQFTQLAIGFFNEKEIIEFDGNYNPGSDELFEIQDFPLNQEIIDSATNNLNYDVLDVQNLDSRIKAVYATYEHNGNIQVYFQVFDTRKIIANRGIPLFNNNGTYSRFENKGIVILNNLTLVYRDSNIYFSSYFNAKRVIPLSDYYIEATNEDVGQFAAGNILNFEDQIGFEEDLNSNLRKKIKSIQQRGVLENLTIQDLQNQANQFGIEFNYNNGQVSVPRDKNYVKRLIKFLDEDYFITPLTNRRCVTNSKREMN
ncbi:MAG: Kiwa anti-phage protein KwaB-like domain-containing protein [Flavobacteriaceae bacterium]